MQLSSLDDAWRGRAVAIADPRHDHCVMGVRECTSWYKNANIAEPVFALGPYKRTKVSLCIHSSHDRSKGKADPPMPRSQYANLHYNVLSHDLD